MKATERCRDRLGSLDQEHLIPNLKEIGLERLLACEKQLGDWTPELSSMLKKSWLERSRFFQNSLSRYRIAENRAKRQPQGRIGIVILAGGQGSRLGHSGPKGCFPLLGKSLFERQLEKLRSKQIPVAIMASKVNFEETKLFLQSHAFFGLPHIHLFSQGVLPLLDDEGRWFWDEIGKIAEGPDGNGSVFKAFVEAGLYEQFLREGVETVHIVPIDNPLADPFDPELIAVHLNAQADLTVNCIRIEDEAEAMGRLVLADGKLAIAEFAELTSEQRQIHRLANTGLLAIDLKFFYELSKKEFPLHWARKAAFQNGEKTMVWKAERFIVDALAFARKPQAKLSKRESCYAPLKEMNKIGEIERLLMEKERADMIYSPA